MTETIPCKQRLEQFLRERGVAYQVQHHPAAVTAQEMAESEHVPGKDVAKTVIVFADGRAVMVLLPATRWLQNSRLASALGASQARLAEEGEFESLFPDCEMPVLGFPA